MPNHPYQKFAAGPLWRTIEKEIAELIANRDLSLTTAPEYVIGAMCKAIVDAGLVVPAAEPRTS